MLRLEISKRLREERKRIKLNQDEVAGAGEVTPTTQGNYESGKRVPDAEYLSLVSKIGIDSQYVLTGVRSPNWPPDSTEKSTQIKVEELMDTLKMIRQETDKGMELVKKMR